MTAQISDGLIYKGDHYEIIGLDGGGLLTPFDFDMEPMMRQTACYRGFYAKYELVEDSLYLSELNLWAKNEEYVPIDGKLPVPDILCSMSYKGLGIPVKFSGKIKIAKDIIRGLQIRMGFQKATAFETVLIITIGCGKVVNVSDISPEIKKKRGVFKKQYDSQTPYVAVSTAFSLNMNEE